MTSFMSTIHAWVILEEGISIKTMLPPDWPVEKPVVYFLDWSSMWKGPPHYRQFHALEKFWVTLLEESKLVGPWDNQPLSNPLARPPVPAPSFRFLSCSSYGPDFSGLMDYKL